MTGRVVFILSCLVLVKSLSAQITPPGLGDTKVSGWCAVGMRQSLDTASRIQSMTYFGVGRISGPTGNDPYNKPGIMIFNQEFYNQFSKHWQYSVALSYRRQNEYIKVEPFSEDDPRIKQEFRVYGRFSYLWSKSRLKVVTTFRQEYRRFYTPDFIEWSESSQLRSRGRVQLSIDLDKSKKHRLVTTAEALFAMNKRSVSGSEWTNLKYTESRFSCYYSHRPHQSPFLLNLGYMYNLVGKRNNFIDGHYLAFDIIWENPFGKPKPKDSVRME